MHRVLPLLAAFAAALALSTIAQATPTPSTLKHDASVIRFFANHPRLARTTAGELALWQVLGHVVQQLRTVQSARVLTSIRPAHYQLWMCIHNREGAWYDDTGNGYFNGLQMSYGWLGIVPGNPDNYTPIQIMTYAETGYRQSGYSRAWLEGQWPNTSPPCLQYA